MSEEHLANKSQPPSASPDDAEYDAIYATISETAQGRRFLEEYARRSQPSDTGALAAIERMQTAMRSSETAGRLDLLLEMADMAQAIARVRAEITAIELPPGSGPAEAMEELDAIVHMTERATSRILAAAEMMQEIAWTLRESGANNALCDHLDTQATEIYTACSFQDLTGQRTRKVIQVLHYLEERINAVTSGDREPAGIPAVHDTSGRLIQADVDAMMQPSTREQRDDRQDATLEDISRLMLAIEPLIGQPTGDEPVEQPDANIQTPVPEDVRPELFVAERIKAEAENALNMAEWAVERGTPAAATPIATVEWFVEHPSAPRPESEPAWMVLQRMETEVDEPEARAHSPSFVPSPPIPPIPAVPAVAEPVRPPSPPVEPGLFVVESMSQLATTLRPVSLLPPPELVFRTKLPAAEPLAELQTAMQTVEMKLPQPDDPVDVPEAVVVPEPQPEPPPPIEMPEPAQHAAAVAAEPFADETPAEAMTVAAESDPDDFLFAPDTAEQHQAHADVFASAPQAMIEETARETQPQQTMVAMEAQPEAAQPKPRPASDPLAPLRGLSEAQKIALFS